MKTRARFVFLAAAVAGTALLALQGPVKLPPPYHTPSAMNPPRVIPRPEGARLRLPPGFDVAVYAEGFERPRFMLLGPSGEVLLSDSADNGAVYVLADQNQDFTPEIRKTLLRGLDRPYGLAFWKDYLYVAETTSLKRYRYDAKTMTVGPGEEIVPMREFGSGHWTRTVLFDRKGEKMYLAIGSRSNVSPGRTGHARRHQPLPSRRQRA